MKKPSNVPPSTEELQAFSRGMCEPDRCDEIEAYLSSGPDCSSIFEAARDDKLTVHLRGVKELPKTPVSTSASSTKTVESNPEVYFTAFQDHPRYRLIRKLGEGGMGIVFLAEHLLMKRQVAIKLIRTGYLGNAKLVARFRQEVQAAASLAHPNIVTAHDADEVAGFHFLVMEYVEGESLAVLVSRQGSLPAKQACEYIRQAARGLEFAHSNGMVHRDIKPHNLMRSKDGTVKMLDFGLARIWLDEASRDEIFNPSGEFIHSQCDRLSMTGTVVGTADYAAPEQIHDSRQVDRRADIYSLGCTLYQLITGRIPSRRDSARDMTLNHAKPGLEPQAIPRGVARVIEKMTAKNIEDRYQSAAEVVVALSPFAVNSSEVAFTSRLRSRWILAMIGFLSLCLVTVILANWTRTAPTDEPKNAGSGDVNYTPVKKAQGGLLHHITGMPARTINAHFSPDGKYVSLEGSTKTPFVRVWEVETGQSILTVTDIADVWQPAAFTPDNRYLTIHPDGHVRSWDLESKQSQLLPQFDNVIEELGEGASVSSVSPDGKIVVFTVDHDDQNFSSTLVAYSTGQVCFKVDSGPQGVLFLTTAFSPDCQKFFVVHANKDRSSTLFSVWSVEKKCLINQFTVPDVSGHGRVAIRDGGRQIGLDFAMQNTNRYQFAFWDTETGQLVHQVALEKIGDWTSACVSPTGQFYAHVSIKKAMVKILDLNSGELVLAYDHIPGADFGDISADGRFAAVPSYGGMHLFRLPEK